MNLPRIKQEDFLTGLPMNRESWSWRYGGARATHGFRSGKLYFEASSEIPNLQCNGSELKKKLDPDLASRFANSEGFYSPLFMVF